MIERMIELISYEDASFGYYGEPAIIQGVTGQLPIGNTVWVTGPTGSGKSTFIRSLVGLVGIRTGTIKFNENSLYNLSFEEFLPYRLRIGYGFETGGLINNKTLKENVALPLQYHNKMEPYEIKQKVEEVFDYFDLTEHMYKRPSMVIGAVRKLVCQLRAFIMDPELLVLDDPTTGLGDELEYQFTDYLQTYMDSHPGVTVVFTSRSQKFGEDMASKVIEVTDQTVSGLDPLILEDEEEEFAS